MLIDELSALVTRRSSSLFAEDLSRRRGEIASCISGSRTLVIGGAGSIGAATVELLARFRPRVLHVVDQSENNLVELVRDLRSRPGGLPVSDFHTFPIDFGSPLMRRLLREQRPYDYVLNFAALKHVRSEKDTCSLLQMLDTNIVKPARLLAWLAEKGRTKRYFCVSTDKAAHPVNLMGASKRVMEHVAFCGEVAGGFTGAATSARFANVAFSDGSLLQGFLKRLEKRQPLAVPRDTRRFFFSLEEAGQICVLAACCAPHKHLLIPRLDPADDLHDLAELAEAVLRCHGFEPRVYDDEDEARQNMARDLAHRCYPLLLTELNTAGEKPYEEFLGDNEQSVEIGLASLLGVAYRPAPCGCIAQLLERLEELAAHPELPAGKHVLVEAISAVVPDFRHRESEKCLDQRM